MNAWPLFGLLLPLAAGSGPSPGARGLDALGSLEGRWSCRLGSAVLEVRVEPRHARPDQLASPVESYALSLAGAPVAREGFRYGLVTFDPSDGLLHVSLDGRCGQPEPIEDDDDPDTGLRRCAHLTGTARETSGGWIWTLARSGAGAARSTLTVQRPSEDRLTLRWAMGPRGRTGSCARSQ